jgi:mannose-6-phosphate isomerase-like protein (cupin superfamily)
MDRFRDTNEIRGASPEKPRKVNLFESASFFADVHVLAPGQSQALHRHAKEDKCWLVLSGRGVVTAGGRDHPVGPGQMVWSPPGEDHGVRCEGPEDLRLLVFMAPHPKPPARA